jgi:DNA polymerase-3 subunit gamma/tau
MSYRVYARKFRPQNFDEVVGQPHITTTLKNAILMDKLAHAYLFAGPRGTGKTSTARIFAMALNCKNGPTSEPCNKCPSCNEIKNGMNLDLIEIDGASNRRIEDIRNLRENVKFQPTSGKFKIYIIDEAHMLTDEAFNALLKTLEEPPPHVKIILATTLPHKVPATIISRCQRFDFRKIPVKEIITKLKSIAAREHLNINEDALFEIVKISEGSMRDAESVLEQVGIFSDGKIKFEDVTAVLGIVPQDIIFNITESFIDKDSKKALSFISNLINEGKDVSQFVTALVAHFRNILIARIVNKDSISSLIEASKEQLDLIVKQSLSFSAQDIFYIINVLLHTQELIRRHQYDRIILEVTMVKLTQRENLVALDELLDRLSSLTSEKTQAASEVKNNNEKKAVSGQVKNEENLSPPKGPSLKEKDGKGPINLEAIKSCWGELIEILKDEKMSVATLMLDAKIIGSEDSFLIIGVPDGLTFHKESLERAENKKLIEEILSRLAGQSLKITFTTYIRDAADTAVIEETEEGVSEDTEVGLPQKEEFMEEPSKEEGSRDDSILKLTLKLFGGKVVEKDKEMEKGR